MLTRIKTLFKKGFFHIIGSNVINKVVTFLSAIVLIRFVSKNDYGVYSYALNIVGIAEIFSTMGVLSGSFQLCAENSNNIEKREQIYNYGCYFGILFNILISLALIVISLFVELPLEGTNELLLFCVIIPIVYIVPEYKKNHLRLTLDNQKFSWANTIGAVLTATLTLVGAFIFGIKGAIIGRTFSFIITFLVILFLFKVGISLRKTRIEKEDKKALFSISFVTMINSGFSQLLYLLDVFLIGLIVSSTVAVASYKTATTIPTALNFIPASIAIFIYPYFAAHKDDLKWVRNNYKKCAFYLMIFNLFLCSVLFIFANQIVVLAFGKEYIDSVPVFRILVINYFINSTFKAVLGNIFVMLRRLKYNLFETIFSCVLNVVGDVVFVGLIGMNGAAYVTLSVTILMSVISLFYFLHITKENNIVFPLKDNQN